VTGSATRLDVFSLVGWLFTLGSFFENFRFSPKFWATFSYGNSHVFNCDENGLGHIVSDLFTNLSGHTGDWHLHSGGLSLNHRLKHNFDHSCQKQFFLKRFFRCDDCETFCGKNAAYSIYVQNIFWKPKPTLKSKRETSNLSNFKHKGPGGLKQMKISK
jgi:hypothetical protein